MENMIVLMVQMRWTVCLNVRKISFDAEIKPTVFQLDGCVMEFMTVWMAAMKKTVTEEEIYVEQMNSFAIIPFANYISGCVMEKMTVETTLTKPLICASNFFAHPQDLTDAEIIEYVCNLNKCAMGLMTVGTTQMKITVVVSLHIKQDLVKKMSLLALTKNVSPWTSSAINLMTAEMVQMNKDAE